MTCSNLLVTCNRLKCPLARLSSLQCYNMGHNGHGIKPVCCYYDPYGQLTWFKGTLWQGDSQSWYTGIYGFRSTIYSCRISIIIRSLIFAVILVDIRESHAVILRDNSVPKKWQRGILFLTRNYHNIAEN